MSQTTSTLSSFEKALCQLCMKEAAAHPADYLARVRAKTNPAYWEIYWACYAAVRLGDNQFARSVFDKYVPEDSEGNDFYLLLAYGKYLEYLDKPDDECIAYTSYDFLSCADGFISPLLQDAFDALLSLIPVPEEGLGEPLHNFYTQKLFVKTDRLTLPDIRQRIDETKSAEEWQAEIVYLTNFFVHRCDSNMLHFPEGYKGREKINVPEFQLVESGKKLTCCGMRNLLGDEFELWLTAKDNEEVALPLRKIRNMDTYRSTVVALLQAIEGVEAWENDWMAD